MDYKICPLLHMHRLFQSPGIRLACILHPGQATLTGIGWRYSLHSTKQIILTLPHLRPGAGAICWSTTPRCESWPGRFHCQDLVSTPGITGVASWPCSAAS